MKTLPLLPPKKVDPQFIAWLLGCIAEDEAVARVVLRRAEANGGLWVVSDSSHSVRIPYDAEQAMRTCVARKRVVEMIGEDCQCPQSDALLHELAYIYSNHEGYALWLQARAEKG